MEKIRLLVVDDSMLYREVLTRYLKLDDMIMIVGKGGDAYSARDLILQHEPDVMTLDLELPRMDGVDFLQKLLPQYYIPTVVISSAEGRKNECKQAGAVEFLKKPTSRTNYDIVMFAAEISRAVRKAYKSNHPDSNIDVNKIPAALQNAIQATAQAAGQPVALTPGQATPKDPMHQVQPVQPAQTAQAVTTVPKAPAQPAQTAHAVPTVPKAPAQPAQTAHAVTTASKAPAQPAQTAQAVPTAPKTVPTSAQNIVQTAAQAAAQTAAMSAAAHAASASVSKPNPAPPPAPQPIKHGKLKKSEAIIALGASTGGTEALESVIRNFPADTPPVIIVQHMPAGFTKLYSERLDRSCKMRVKEAQDGDRLERGLIIVGAGDYHLRLCKDARGLYVSSKPGEKVSGHCPSVDVMFNSVADVAGPLAIGAILTGMGRDGADGLLRMRNAGSFTIGQDKDTCVVYGMPMEAYNCGAVEVQAPLYKIAEIILNQLY